MNVQNNKNFNLKTLTQLGLLIALQVVLSRFLSIHTPIVKIGFGFLPLAIMGILYGPFIGGVGAIVADIIGIILFPTGAYFPGFTLTTGLTGFVYGSLLYNKPKSPQRILIATLIISLGLNLLLNTLWLSIIMGKGYLALLPTRVAKALIMIPVEFITISIVWNKFLLKVKGFLVVR